MATAPSAIVPMTTPRRRTRMLMAAPVGLLEDVRDCRRELLVRLVPACLEVLLPVLCPRTAVIVDETRVGRGVLGGPAVGVAQVAQTLDVAVSAVGIVEACRPIEADDVA